MAGLVLAGEGTVNPRAGLGKAACALGIQGGNADFAVFPGPGCFPPDFAGVADLRAPAVPTADFDALPLPRGDPALGVWPDLPDFLRTRVFSSSLPAGMQPAATL